VLSRRLRAVQAKAEAGAIERRDFRMMVDETNDNTDAEDTCELSNARYFELAPVHERAERCPQIKRS
jgi:hypothetical protein